MVENIFKNTQIYFNLFLNLKEKEEKKERFIILKQKFKFIKISNFFSFFFARAASKK
jgi:hypothetical protein